MKYQDLKIRDAGRLFLIGLCAFGVGMIAMAERSIVQPVLRGDYWPIVVALDLIALLFLAMTMWYVLSSPAQDAEFLEWAERNLKQKPGPKFDPKLLDAADPNYRTPTFRYWLDRRDRRAG